MSRLARPARLNPSTATSTRSSEATSVRTVRKPAIGSRRHRDPQFQSGDRIVGDAANEVDVDAKAATSRATAPNARAVIGRPST